MYHCVLPSEQSSYIVHELIRRDQGVVNVEHNQIMEWQSNFEDQVPAPPSSPEPESSHSKRWNVFEATDYRYNHRMISSGKKEDLGSNYDALFSARRLDKAGAGVDVYVVDSGIRISHRDFVFGDRPLPVDFSSLTGKVIPYCTISNTWVSISSCQRNTYLQSTDYSEG